MNGARAYADHVPDAIFAHPRLARIYDTFNGPRDDLPPYLAIAEELGATKILDVGCGTGNLALALAGRGLTVVGIDPAKASLEVARSKAAADQVTWLHGTATSAPAADFDLATMTGNVAQVFLTEEDWTGTLRGIHAALRPDGHLVFETRRPEFRAWEGWEADWATVTHEIPGIGEVTERRESFEIKLPYVYFRGTYRFTADGAEITSESTLRFRSREEIESSLTEAGYAVVEIRDAPDRPGREYVFIARRT